MANEHDEASPKGPKQVTPVHFKKNLDSSELSKKL